MSQLLRCIPLVAFCVLSASWSASAQSAPTADAPQLQGTVFDETGGFMPGVNVVLHSGPSKRTAKTDDAGRFGFTGVAPGDYILESTRPGFRSARHELKLRAPEDWTRIVTMIVGDLSEAITIVGARGGRDRAGTPAPGRGGSIRPPQKTKHVLPEYPAHLRAQGLEADVRLEGAIGSDGKVSWVRATHSAVHPDFVKAAIDCVRQWTYEPTRLNGTAIGVYMTVTITFRLE
jgi:TonB family protein